MYTLGTSKRGVSNRAPGIIHGWMIALTVVLVLGATTLWAGGGPNVAGAKLYIKQNNLDEAQRVLKKEIEQVDPNNEDAWYLLGYVYARRGEYKKMLEAFDKAVELKPEFKEEGEGIKVSGDSGTRFLAQYGVNMIKRIVWGDIFNQAVRYFNDAIAATDDSVMVANYEKAAEQFKLSTLIQPDSAMGYRNWAAALMNMGEYEKSIEPLRQAVEMNPEDAESKTMLAQVYLTVEEDSLAQQVLEELWQEGHRTEGVMSALSTLYLKRGEQEKALEIFKEAVQQSPDNYDLHYNYGVVLLQTDQYNKAIEQFTTAYELNPDAPDLNYNLGAAYLNRGVARRDSLPEDSEERPHVEDFEKAFPYLEKAVMLNPDDQQAWMALGRIAGQLNKIALAGYALAKGEDTRKALDGKVVVGMDAATLKARLGEPTQARPVESENITGVEEWAYAKRTGGNDTVAIPKTLYAYVKDGRVDAILFVE